MNTGVAVVADVGAEVEFGVVGDRLSVPEQADAGADASEDDDRQPCFAIE